MKPKILCIATSGLGENIFMTLGLEELAKNYEVHFAIPKAGAIFFKNYDFISKLIEIPVNPFNVPDEESVEIVRQCIQESEYTYYTSRAPHMIEKFRGLSIPCLEHLPEDKIKRSVGENIITRFGGSVEGKHIKYKPASKLTPDGVRKIVLYMGSTEVLRKVPVEHHNEILKRLLEKYRTTHKIYSIHHKKYNSQVLADVRHVCDGPDNSQELLDLMASGVALLIGPDSGLSNVALTFNIPIVWIETRATVEMIVPYSYNTIVRRFRIKDPECLRNCRGARHASLFGQAVMDHSPSIRDAIHDVKKLECLNSAKAPCLLFAEEDYITLFGFVCELLP